MHLLEIAKQQGFVLKIGTYPEFSTMIANGVRSLFEHPDGRSFVWGLHEAYKPPTLICPRPKIETQITIKRDNGEDYTFKGTEVFDDAMNKALSFIPHEEILEQMFKRDKVFVV